MSMNKQPVYEGADQSLCSSTSSYSEILPRDQFVNPLRKDKPIVIRSIPMVRHKSPQHANHTHQRTAPNVVIDTTKININYNKNQQLPITNHTKQEQNQSPQSQQVILINQNQHNQYILPNQQSLQSKHQLFKQKEQHSLRFSKKQSQTQKDKIDFDNAILNFSMSSMESQKPIQLSPRKPFQQFTDHYEQSKQKSQKVSPQTEIKLKKQIQALTIKNHQLQVKLKELQDKIKNDSQNFDLERKANEIYTEFYQTLSKIVGEFLRLNRNSKELTEVDLIQPLNESMNMEKITVIVTKLIQSFSSPQKPNSMQKNTQTESFPFQQIYKEDLSNLSYQTRIKELEKTIQTAHQINTQLKSQLLQSTQNNINSLFNTQISASCCLQNEVKKINHEITFLKEKINLLLISESHKIPVNHQPQIIYLPQPNSNPPPKNDTKEVNKIIKIYTTKDKVYEQSDSSEANDEPIIKRKRQHSLSRKRKRNSPSKKQKSRSSSSMSSKSTKKREEMSRREIQQLKQAYNQTKNELNSLIHTFSLINSSQVEMKAYFREIKEDLLRQVNQRITKANEDVNLQRQKKQKIQLESKRQHETILSRRFEERMKEKQVLYKSQIEMLKKQSVHDQKQISQLNKKLFELIGRTSVPQRVIPQNLKLKLNHEDEVPISEISVSVDWLKIIEQLKRQNKKKEEEIQALLKSNDFLTQEIEQMNTREISRKRVNINIYQENQLSRQRKDSIINGLNGFSRASVYPSLPIKTNDNFQLTKKSPHVNSHQSQQFLQGIQEQQKSSTAVRKVQSSKVIDFQVQKNVQTNFRVILNSKETQIRSLQQEILNLQETIEYLKEQMSIKERTISQLEGYIVNLQNRSVNSNSLSQQKINMEREVNVYMDPNHNIDSIKIKYENYVKNLKLLLKETQNQNKTLKQKLQNMQNQPDKLTQSNFCRKNSATHSERTTKNFPHSSSPTHPKSHAQIFIRKRSQKYERMSIERHQQRINSLANQKDLHDEINFNNKA